MGHNVSSERYPEAVRVSSKAIFLKKLIKRTKNVILRARRNTKEGTTLALETDADETDPEGDFDDEDDGTRTLVWE
jgi:hypothetical protein